jgi:hypothetical protein
MQTLVGAEHAAESSSFHLWHVPGKPVSICLSHDVAQALRKRRRRWFGLLRGRAPENGGILLGTEERDGEQLVLRIEDSLEVPCEHLFGPSYCLSGDDQDNLRRALDEFRTGRTRPLGFYRTHTRRGHALDQDDLLLLSEFFPRDTDLALLVKRRAFRRSLAVFFLAQDASVEPDSRCLQVPLSGRRARKSRAPEPAPAEPPKETAKPPRTPFWCSWWIQAPLLACLLAADGLLGFFSARQFNNWMTPAAAARDPYALSLMVLEYGDNLHLSWDRNARAVAAAEGGLLLITDGGQSRSLDLSTAQLQNGSVIYRKVTSQVRFRLEVFLKGRRSVSETWEPPDRAAQSVASEGQPPVSRP